VVIVGAARTPIGAFLGELAHLAAPKLGACAIEAAVERAGTPKTAIDACVMGCVLTAGLGQAPARQTALGAGLGVETGCVTVNKMCGSGMQAMMIVHDQLLAGSVDLAIAGGMESMSNAPYLLDRARTGFRIGHGRAIDHMFFDGLEDAYEKGRLMGSFAEDCATAYQFTRKMQDEFALRSLARAQKATEEGLFDKEITPVSHTEKAGAAVIRDELPRKAKAEAIERLRPAFRPDGTLTAANSSAISDGAAAFVLMRMENAEREGLTPRARIVAHVTHAGPPDKFPTAPISATGKLLDKVGWRAESVDLYEINEAFAVVTMAAMHDLRLPEEKMNVHGGACALGHPIGASGARIVVTLLAALERYDLRRGVAALCIGGGEATALAVERLR
jgi:acetyl-CoA C-acetyltransferase